MRGLFLAILLVLASAAHADGGSFYGKQPSLLSIERFSAYMLAKQEWPTKGHGDGFSGPNTKLGGEICYSLNRWWDVRLTGLHSITNGKAELGAWLALRLPLQEMYK